MEIISVLIQKLGSYFTHIATSLPKFVMDLFIFTLTLYYTLLNSTYLSTMVRKLTPLTAEEFQIFHKATHGIFRGVILGTMLAAICQGTLIFIGYLSLNIPEAFLFGVFTAFLSIVPFLGTLPTGIGACIYLVLQQRYLAAFIMLLIFTFAGVSDNIIKPMVLKDAMELHPLLGLLGVLGGLALFGFIGLFLGPLMVALGVISIKILANRGQLILPPK